MKIELSPIPHAYTLKSALCSDIAGEEMQTKQ